MMNLLKCVRITIRKRTPHFNSYIRNNLSLRLKDMIFNKRLMEWAYKEIISAKAESVKFPPRQL